MTIRISKGFLLGLGAVVLVAAGVGAGLLIAGGGDGDGGTTEAAATDSSSTTTTEESSLEDVAEGCKGNVVNGVCEPDPDPTPPEPEGTYKIASCDLGGGNELIGSVRVFNDGPVPLVAEVPFSWQLGDGSALEAETQRVKLKAAESDLLFFTIPANLKTQLNFQEHPAYVRSRNCRSNVEIVG